jgi:tungstate transport system substrate-binding protein
VFNKPRFRLVTILVLFTVFASLVPSVALAEDPTRLILATTTSTADSGLLDTILPDFEEQFNADMEVIAVGTGQALKLGEDGNADVILVHARAREDKFVAEGHGVNRQDVMHNDFVILGPESDPAGIKGMTDAARAFKKIAEAEAPFVSRGDDSGTHTKEKGIWSAAGIEPEGDWYIEAGQGMGAVLTMANEQLAYTMSDRGTYLARTLEGTDLIVLVEGDAILFNPYGVIAINPEKYDTANYDLAMDFIAWLTSVETQQQIAEFQHPSGKPLFIPNSEEWNDANSELSGKITIFHAGSLTVPVKEMMEELAARYPDVTFETEASESVDCAQKMSELEGSSEVMMSADYAIIDKLLNPD